MKRILFLLVFLVPVLAATGIAVAAGAFDGAKSSTARFHDLGAGYYTSRIDRDHKTRNHVRQLQALGYSVTLTPAA